jgi:hypothetical protein
MEFPWKRIDDNSKGEALLFNLEQDPGEKHDLYESQPEIAASLAAQVEKVLSESTQVEVRELDPGVEEGELRDRLKELGYID